MFDRHLTAQASPTAGHAAAMAELEVGRKTGHWIWYVFPQLAGLGRSEVAKRFAISGYDEARQYLQHPVLGGRLLEATQEVLRQVSPAEPRPLSVVMGSRLDCQKLVSSLTLFGYTAEMILTVSTKEVMERALALALACRQVLEVAEQQGFGPDLVTLDAMPETPPCGACGGQPAPDPPTSSSAGPCSYGRCLRCQDHRIEGEFMFELAHKFPDCAGDVEHAKVYVDGQLLTWTEWLAAKGLQDPLR